MRFRLFIILIFITAVAIPKYTKAQEVITKRSSVIEKYKGKPYYIHFVKQGETLTGIAKAYNVTQDELNAENPEISKGLKADMVLRIPQKAVVVVPETTTPVIENQNLQIKSTDNHDYTLYVVKKQETLYGISRMFNLTVEDILNANPGLVSLQEGMEIKIPNQTSTSKTVAKGIPADNIQRQDTSSGEITVKTGETLYSIAKAYNTTMDELIDLNPQLTDGLKAGMILRIRKRVIEINVNPDLKYNPDSIIQPLTKSDCYDSVNIKTTYKIALLLPFMLGKSADALDAPIDQEISGFESFNYFQFYAGFMLAADSLEKTGLRARIQVLDADKLNDTLTIRQALRKQGMDKMDLLIGPIFATSFNIAARFAQKNKIGIINPLSRRESIVKGNPYVIKTQASGSGIAAKLSAFIINHYPNSNIIAVIADKKEFSSISGEFAMQLKAGITTHTFNGTLQEANYSTDLMTGVTKKLKPGVKNIVILFSNNKNKVPNFVSLLNPYSKNNDIILIGMDGWEDLNLETEFLVNLKFHQVTSSYIDYESEAVQQFILKFRNKYGAVPMADKYAFLGYDIGWYFLNSLMMNGEKYISCLSSYMLKGLQNNFIFRGSQNGDGFQNQDITITKLQDYRMVRVD